MLIAEQKRKDNIAEYILYMWQVEDTIRACNFDIDLIEERIISQFKEKESVLQNVRDWYINLMLMMHEEKKKESGHLTMFATLIQDLYSLHLKLLQTKMDPKYLEQYSWAEPNIREFEKRLPDKPANDIETCFTALYALLLLRLRKREISEETMHAMQSFSNLLAILSKWYKEVEAGNIEI